jgi:uncharacterized protein (TIGR01777 family)
MNVPKSPLDFKKTILLSGASGMLGQAIAADLTLQGFAVLRLVRQAPSADDQIRWDPAAVNAGLDLSRLEGLYGAIHLSGANVASRRWTPAYKREIANSRIHTTTALAQAFAHLERPPQTFVSASAVGYYGNRGDTVLDESSAPGTGFFPELCLAWEQAAQPAANVGIRVIHPRFGVVLGPKGGALDRLRTLFGLGLGGRLGDGRQWMSWVSQADAASAVLFALENPRLTGSFNVTAPNPVTNTEFTHQLAAILHRPAFMTAPAFALRLAFGEMADEALLASSRSVPRALLNAGFVFQQPTLHSALEAILKSPTRA